MKILFIGSVDFSKSALKKIIDMKENVVGVVCKNSLKFNSDFYDLSLIAKKNKIPYIYVKNINSEDSVIWIKEKEPDVIYCFGWSQIIKSNILKIPRLGVIGFHPAEIPFNKGRHPLIWALFLGLNSTASTFFFMDEGADTGDILSQVNVPILPNDDAESLYYKITKIALSQIEEFTSELKTNNYQRIPQTKNIGNFWRKRGIEDGHIDWRMSSLAIYNLVRALTKPYVGAHITIDENNIKIWKVEIIEKDFQGSNLEPGKVIKINEKENTFDVKSYDGIIRVLKHDINDMTIIGEYLK